MWAGAVDAPFLSTSAGMDSMISMSRSVAVSFSRPFAASIRTFYKIGIVLRRSTTLWTWPRAFKKAPRSTLIFIVFRFQEMPFGCRFWAAFEAIFGPCGPTRFLARTIAQNPSHKRLVVPARL
jgi:hypothetical protein